MKAQQKMEEIMILIIRDVLDCHKKVMDFVGMETKHGVFLSILLASLRGTRIRIYECQV